jgi:outer membrane lipoprotein-sorting protein
MDARKIRFCLATAAAALVLASCVRTSKPIGLDEIVANNQAAESGHANTANIRSIRIDLSMQDSGSSFDAVYTATRDGRMRIDIIAGGTRVYTEAYDGHEGWDYGKDGSVPVVDPYAAALWHGTQFPGQIFGLHDLAANGHSLEYTGRETIEGIDYYVLKITLSDGFVTYRYINPRTWMIERGRDFRAFHPAIDDKKTWIETVWSDYRPVDGVMRAFLSVNTDLTSGKVQATNRVTSIKINPDVDASIFVRPSSAPAS